MTFAHYGTQCRRCRHFTGPVQQQVGDTGPMATMGTCTAFHGLIPIQIWQDKFDHRQAFPGDHGLRFTPEPGERSPFDGGK